MRPLVVLVVLAVLAFASVAASGDPIPPPDTTLPGTVNGNRQPEETAFGLAPGTLSQPNPFVQRANGGGQVSPTPTTSDILGQSSGSQLLSGGKLLTDFAGQILKTPSVPDNSGRDLTKGKGAFSGAIASGQVTPLVPPANGNTRTIVSGTNGAATPVISAADQLLQGQPQKADEGYQQVLAQDPNNTAALAGHISALTALGQRTEATAAAKRLLVLDPTNELARQTVEQSSKLDRAEGITNKFKKLADGLLHGPEDDAAAAGKAQALKDLAGTTGSGAQQSRQGDPRGQGPAPTEGAVPAGAPATLAFGPLLRKALTKQAVGDFTGALIDVSQEIDSNPNDPAAWTLRAELDLQLSNYPAGITDSSRALDLAPDNARALRARSYGEYETRLYKQALADASRAVALDPKNGLGFIYKAMAEEKLGLDDAALSDLNQALALDPTLRRLAAPLLRKFNLDGGAADVSGRSLKPWMLRGGFVVLAMLFVFIGLLGTQKAKTLKAVLLTPRRAQTDAPGDAAELVPGSVLGGGYRIVREIGRGGMGVVYEGMDESLQRRVAVKRLLQDDQSTPDDTERFLREARLVAQLKHPNLAQIYAVAVEREPFLVFEYVDGETLDGALSRSVVLPVADARRILAEIASALSYAHAHNIIHRDLKPSNVMITKSGAAKVMDFGIAHQARTSATQLTQTIACGTPPYMSPEQGMGSVSKSSDLYALGVMAYELLTGRRPFEGPNYLNQKLERRYEPATRLNPALPPAIDRFFESALDPDPTKRPASASAFMEALGRACDATPRRQASTA